ncbi:hypothetical protein GE061_015473 [Apolygus lucorum]|uniref:Uncharacterized protein n=1 Tax=Apolygus lucorum TaxID=248454 RepID=A0A8S9XM92_APOLU|nr:hypothetical protein GE061_015473 [Apolygus lucorum]
MFHVFLALSLSFVGTAWSLPQELNDAMIHVGASDNDLVLFHKALKKKDFSTVSKIYERLEKNRVLLASDASKLRKAVVPENAKTLKKLISMQLDHILFKIQGTIPEFSEHSGVSTEKYVAASRQIADRSAK